MGPRPCDGMTSFRGGAREGGSLGRADPSAPRQVTLAPDNLHPKSQISQSQGHQTSRLDLLHAPGPRDNRPPNASSSAFQIFGPTLSRCGNWLPGGGAPASDYLRTIRLVRRMSEKGTWGWGVFIPIMLLPRTRSEPGTCQD